ncbi:MAG: nucleoside hydrolase [Mariniphaga sp.]
MVKNKWSIINGQWTFGRLNFTSVIFLLLVLSCQVPAPSAIEPVKIIFDSDMGPDYDDVGALTMLHAFADSGKAEILGTMASNKYALVAPCLEVINTYYGRSKIPVGSPKTHGVSIGCSQHWTDSLVANYPHHLDSTSHAQDAVLLYRKILANQADTSVVIVTVGFLTNLNDLLVSDADTISPLNGKQLILKKVKKLVAMAGKFPEGSEFNVKEDSTSSKYVFDHWPRQIIFSGFEIGDHILTGKKLIGTKLRSPAKMAFSIAIPMSDEDQNGRKSWDQTAVLTAVKGADFAFGTVKGMMVVEPSGFNRWNKIENGTHSYLVFKKSPEVISELIDQYMMHEPVSQK